MISVIIPLAPQEDKWKELAPQLSALPKGSEIILVTGIGERFDISGFENLRVVEGKSGRAGRMNSGAECALNDFLWFLHADSKFAPDAIEKLVDCFGRDSDALYYHDLKFMDDGPKLIKLNEKMVRWRSDFFKIPFGDQGFAISKELFFEMGGYCDDCEFGEDHLFTWKVRQEGYPVKRTGASIHTSARKYEKGGWGRVTALHVFLTFKQGLPELVKLLRKRFL